MLRCRLNRRPLRLLALENRTVPATFFVKNSFDAGPDSLREAVNLANLTPGIDDVVFDPLIFGVPQPPVALTSGTIFASEPVNIKGTTSANCIVSGSGLSRVFLFNSLAAAQPFVVSDISITGGITPAGGAGIYSPDEAVTLKSCVVSGNKSGSGGGVQIDLPIASLTANGCLFDSNGTFGGPGGAVNVPSGSIVRLNTCRFVGNTAGEGGAAAFGFNSDVKMNTCEFIGNTAILSGGGVAYSGIALTARNSTFAGNTAGDSGGGLALIPPGPLANMLVEACTFTGNAAGPFGGGIGGKFGWGTSVLTLRNTTVSGNVADMGGGIGFDSLSAASDLTLQNTTITLNETKAGMGGGLALLGPSKGFATFSSTIVAGNKFGGGPIATADVAFGVLTKVVGNNNLIGVDAPPTLAFYVGVGNQIGPVFPPLDAKLAPLAANGGPTLTHLPTMFSPAIDKGNNSVGLATDQRGAGFPRVLGPDADVGAVETKSKIITGGGKAPDVLMPGGTSQTITVTYNADVAVETASLSSGDITIVDPTGVSHPVLFTGVDIPFPGTPRVATYVLAAPGGFWDAADNGMYTIVQSPFEVFDAAGLPAPAGAIGSFKAVMPTTIVVNATNDEAIDTDGKTSLREAVLLANEWAPSADLIIFDPVVFAASVTIPLKLGQIKMTDSATVVGPGNVTIDAGGQSRHFTIDNAESALAVKLQGLTLVSGQVVGEHGGSILVTDEWLTLERVELLGNSALPLAGGGPAANGGAIAVTGSDGVLQILASRLKNNSALGGSGGAVHMHTTFGRSGKLEFRQTTVCDNVAQAGGGVSFAAGGSLNVIDSTFTVNQAGVAGAAGGGGGGVWFSDPFGTGTLVLTNSTFSENRTSSGPGGGLYLSLGGVGTNVAVWNSTLTLNESSGPGGGIAMDTAVPTPVIHSSTIAAGNKTVAGFPSTADLAFNLPTSVNGDNNLIGVADIASGAVLTGVGNLTGTSVVPLNPGLTPLGAFGGLCLCHQLLPTSPALGKGNNAFGLPFDQRGPGFPRVQGAQADIGSYEAPAPPKVASVVVNGGAVQRSVVKTITVTFSEPVTLGPGALTLTRTGPGGPTGSVALSVTTAAAVANITFAGGGAVPVETSGSLIDGNYVLTIGAISVLGMGGTLDGNGNGASDGSPADNVSFATHRLFGDNDGDKDVDAQDYAAFRGAFGGTSNLAFDFDGDGDVDAADYAQFRGRFGTAI